MKSLNIRSNPQRDNLEASVFKIITLAVVIFMVYDLLNDLILGSRPLTFILDVMALVLMTVFCLIVWVFVYREWIAIVYFGIQLLALILAWPTLGGINGPDTFNFFVVTVLVVIILKGYKRNVFLVLIMGSELVLVYFDLNYPSWSVNPLPESTRLSIPIHFILQTMVVSLVVIYLKINFEQERSIIHEQNLELIENNKLIASQNEELRLQQEEIEKINRILEEKVKERTEDLTLKNKQLAEYTFLNTHKLRGPLSRMMGLMNLMDLDHTSLSERQDYFKYIHISLNELDNIVRQINNKLEEEIR